MVTVRMMKTTMKKIMTKTTSKAALALALLAVTFGGAFGSELTDAANDDWLELVRRHTSADTIANAELSYRWNNLVQKHSGSNESLLSEWWREIGDNLLTELIERAFSSNRDLQSARAKVIEARAQLGISTSAFRPKAEGVVGYTNGRNSELEDEELRSYNEYAMGIDASWELDMFGKNKHILDAAKANLEAEYANLHDAWVSLSAEVAVNYITLRTLQNRAGLKDALEVQQERYALENAQAEIPDIEQAINKTMNALAVLTGEIPGSLNKRLGEVKSIPEVNESELIGIPAQTLRQRPDIREAERRLAAQISTRKAAQKSAYPVIALTGSIGLESLSTGNLFSSGAYGFTLGPRITWPIFNGGEIQKEH